ncbi:MAG TPA: DNA alkylation repair protein, partial [Anaerovoracaceae bacterium]|nr:DNA alkylation repair protein [Anaerovoracaceae bacterium]
MKPEDLYNDIVAFCKSNTNEEIIIKYSRYFKQGQWDAYGLTQHLMYGKVKDIIETKDVDMQLIRETSRLLIRSIKYEESSFAILLYKSLIKNFDRQIFDDITLWFETGIRNWAHCDTICGELMFPLLKMNIISFNDLKLWINENNKFQRRAVPVSFIKLLKTTDDYLPFFGIIEPLMIDPEREVHQGVGWFLREAWKKQRTLTESFLLEWKEISP